MTERKRRGLFDWLMGGTDELAVAREGEAQLDAARRPESALESRLHDEGQIAKGGMGSIRQVFDVNLLRRVAMKVLAPEAAKDPVEIQRFLEEAQITGQLEHPNIVPVHELGVEGDTHYFTMKLVQGQTLEHILLEPGYSASSDEHLGQALKIFIKVCEAVSYAHARGVVHLDLKPANVMVGSHGQVYLMDWGIARLLKGKRRAGAADGRVELRRRGELDKQGKVLGTLSYMAPEQADGRLDELDERTDVFSLGAILYRILANRPPHVGKNIDEKWEAAKACQIVPVEQAAPAPVPPRLAQIAMKALSRKPGERQASVAQLQEEVEHFLRGPGRFPVQALKAGAVVVREGEPGDAAFVVLSGRCLAFKTVAGKRQVLREMGPGAVFGETAILTSQPRSASVEASEPTTVMVIRREQLDREVDQSTWMGPIVRALAARFREADERATRQAEQLRQAELTRALLLQLALTGQRQARWPDLGPALAKQLGRSQDALLNELRALDFVRFDGLNVALVEPPPAAPVAGRPQTKV